MRAQVAEGSNPEAGASAAVQAEAGRRPLKQRLPVSKRQGLLMDQACSTHAGQGSADYDELFDLFFYYANKLLRSNSLIVPLDVLVEAPPLKSL